MTPQRVSLITLGVADLAAARRFYARLGWVEHAESQEGVAFFQMQGAALALFSRRDLAADQKRDPATLGTGAVTLAQNFASREAVNRAFAAAVAAGGTALKAPEPVFWGGYSGYWADPDGHVWEVALNPFWPLASDGRLTLPGGVERIAEADLPEADEAGISALLARCFEGFGGRSHYLIRHDWRHVIREEGGIIAHLAVQLRAMRLGGRLITVAGIADVATDPDHRGKGHAAKLLRDAIAQAGQARAEFVLLFGTARIYAAAGFRPVANPIIWVAMPGAVTGEIRRAPAEALMVLPLQGTAWDEAAELDLLGPLF